MIAAPLPADATLPRLLKRNAETRGEAPAMREKSMGIWRTHTWSAYYGMVSDFALGLASLGFRRGDVLAVIGDNRPRLYAAQIAAQTLGPELKEWLNDPQKLLQLIAAAEGSKSGGGPTEPGTVPVGLVQASSIEIRPTVRPIISPTFR
jgi:hypothetical protein